MKSYGKKHIGGLCRHSCRCGEDAPRERATDAENRSMKRRERAAGKKAAAICE